MIYPDYGSYLISQGTPREIAHLFYGVPVTHLSVLGPNLYGFTTNICPIAGVEYCASFDFDQNILNQILLRVPTDKRDEFFAHGSRIRTAVEFPKAIHLDVQARLGDLQQGQREQFVPLVVTEIS